MNEQGGESVGGGSVRSTAVLFASSALRSIIVAAVAKLSPALVEDPSVKWLAELVSIALAVALMAWISTRSTMKRAVQAGSPSPVISAGWDLSEPPFTSDRPQGWTPQNSPAPPERPVFNPDNQGKA